MKKLLWFMMVLLFLILQVSVSFALTYVERTSNYTINSDGSFTYEIFMTYSNPDNYSVTSIGTWNVLYKGAAVSTSNYDDFTFSYNNPAYSRTYDFNYLSPGGSPAKTMNYDADVYTYSFTVDAGATKTLKVSYSGAPGIWADQSSNALYPWVNQYGYWEFVGDGFTSTPCNTFTVNIALPSTTSEYAILGSDMLNPIINGGQMQFTLNNVQQIDMDIVFKTSTPLGTPEPLTILLLGIGLAGLTGARRLFKH